MQEYFRRMREEPGFINLGRSDHRDVRERLFSNTPYMIDHYPNGRYTWRNWHFEVRHDGLHFIPLDFQAFRSMFDEDPTSIIPNPEQGIHAPEVPVSIQPVRIPQAVYVTGSSFWETYWRCFARSDEVGRPGVFADERRRMWDRQTAIDDNTPDGVATWQRNVRSSNVRSHCRGWGYGPTSHC
ncbi:hypothetical protein KEM54_006527 [Ascosphaera aggregata]|nr:hypothetical protein KEM54_006527 [Ascosphaera aggregata]